MWESQTTLIYTRITNTFRIVNIIGISLQKYSVAVVQLVVSTMDLKLLQLWGFLLAFFCFVYIQRTAAEGCLLLATSMQNFWMLCIFWLGVGYFLFLLFSPTQLDSLMERHETDKGAVEKWRNYFFWKKKFI